MLVKSWGESVLSSKVKDAQVFIRMNDRKIDRGMQILVAPAPWEINFIEGSVDRPFQESFHVRELWFAWAIRSNLRSSD